MARALLNALEDMLTAIAHAAEFSKGKDFDAYVRDPLLQAGLERFIERVSEASRSIPDDVKGRYPQVPWAKIAGIGNVLRHNYDGLDQKIIWDTATIDLPALRANLVEIKNKLEWPDADKDGPNPRVVAVSNNRLSLAPRVAVVLAVIPSQQTFETVAAPRLPDAYPQLALDKSIH